MDYALACLESNITKQVHRNCTHENYDLESTVIVMINTPRTKRTK